MKFKPVMSNHLKSDEEILGTQLSSILSSIISIGSGAKHSTSIKIALRILGITSTLWSLFPLAANISSREGDKESEKMFSLLKDQLDSEIKELLEGIDKMKVKE